MKREDFLDLIKAYDAVLRLEDACDILTGVNSLTCGKVSDLNRIYDVIHRNSAEAFFCPDSPDEDERDDSFHEIIESRQMTPEEKCEALLPKQ